MTRRRVLVVDADESFVDWFRKALASSELEIHVAESADDALAKVRRLHADIVFIAVDLPNKNGFGLFSKIRGLAKRARVVLATSTISPHEMSFHQKLRVHADAYLDKRTLGEEELVDTIDSLAHPEPVQPARLPTDTDAEEDVVNDEQESWIVNAQEQHTTSHERHDPPSSFVPAGVNDDRLFQAVDGRASAGTALGSPSTQESSIESAADAPASEHDGTPPSGRVRELELEVDHLSQELEDLRRAAVSSPFSQDFLKLKELADTRAKAITVLEKENLARSGEMKALQGKIDELSQRLEAAQSDTAEILEREKEHKRSLEAAEASLQAAQEASRELERKLARQIQQATEDLNRERQANEESLRHRGREFEKLYGRFEALSHRQTETRSSLREAHAREVVALKKQHGETLSGRDREHQAALSRAAEERKKALSAAEKRRVDELDRAAEKHRAELEEVKDHLKSELEAVEARYEGRIIKLEQEGHGTTAAKEQIERERWEEAERSRDELERERRAHQETRRRYEAKLIRVEEERTDSQKETEEKWQSRVQYLEGKLADAERLIAVREEELEAQNRRLQDHQGTITSMKAVIDDFSRSIASEGDQEADRELTIASLKSIIEDFAKPT